MSRSNKRDAILDEIDSEWVARGTIRPMSLKRWLNMAIDAAKEEVKAEMAPQRGAAPYGSVPYTCSCSEVIAYKGTPEGHDICLACGGAFRMHDVSAPVARATCQCREPEAYCGKLPGESEYSIICNLCGYALSDEARDKLPPRAEKRDFGPELDLSVGEPGTLGDVARAMVEGAASHAFTDGCPGIAAALRYLATARHSTLTIRVSPSDDGLESFNQVSMSFVRASPANHVSRNGE